WVSGAYFEVLGIDMAAGRAFTPAEDRLESPAAVAVVSYGYWQRQFGGDPAVAGRIVQLEDIPFTIVGVAPAAFTGTSTERVDIWMPLASARLLRPEDRWVANVAARRESCCLSLAGRLAPGATREEALAELSLLDRQFREGRDPDAGRLRIAGTTGSGSSAFPPVFAGVVLVLLLASANVANLLLARASARRREIGVRLSLGASRARVVRQLLTESLILAVLAGATGLLVAGWLSAGIVGFMFGATSLRFQTDAGVLAYALAISGLSCVVAGLAPALHGTRTSIGNALKEVTTVPDSRVSLRSAFLCMQVAVSVVLLASAGLLIHALYEASMRDLGFPASDVAVVSFEAPARGYDAQRIRALARQLAETMGALPAPVALASTEPLGSGNIKGGFRVPGSADELFNSVFEVSPAYFDLLGLTAIAGRRLEASDDNRNVIVINETMARRHWTVSRAVGQRILVDPATGGWNTPGELEIVGVVRDVRQTSLEGPPESIIYQPLSGRALPRVLVRDRSGSALAAVRAAAEKADPRLRVRTRRLADNVGVHLTPTRTGALMASVLGGLSLVLATVGMLGVFSYWVQQRTREIGIRVALGARSSQVVRLVLDSSARAIAAGMAVGAIGAGIASRFLGSLLYGINPIDPVTFGAVLCLLGTAGAAATYWPARRAVRVDPVIALRSE
ncbi:MAG TPA: ABC transporter permease, partial [Vicinamibacterales bacterium]|nr:ABC transporter permease [Vicinamibacterales bacterium]